MPAANVPWSPPLTRLPTLMPGQFGVSGTDNTTGLRLDTNAKIIYVDRNHADPHDQRDGTDADSPMATVQAAVDLCRPYMNDTIVVAHNSYWYDTNAASPRKLPVAEDVTVDVPGIRIIGQAPSSTLGVPWIPGTTGGTCLTIDAFDVLVEGFNFMDTGGNNAIGIVSTWDNTTAWGDGLTVRNCFFNTNLDYGIRLEFSYYTDIHNCWFQGQNVRAIEEIVGGSPSSFALIHENWFSYPVAAIWMPACDGNHIHHNSFMGDPKGTNNYINLTGGGANMVDHNNLNCTLGADYNLACSDATSGLWAQNYCIDGPTTAPPT